MPAVTVIIDEDGIDAIAKPASFMPNLILTNIKLPRMNGAEFVKYIRKTERYTKIKIMAMTVLYETIHRFRMSKAQELIKLFINLLKMKI
ncbi:MAG: response regulator [Deltaproteobacteria bacterium]|nr:response regulator [Deltaproteobacteria bacterium]